MAPLDYIHLFGTNCCRLNYLFCSACRGVHISRYPVLVGENQSVFPKKTHVDMKETILFSECLTHDKSIQIWEREENCFVLIEAWWRNIKFTKIRDCQRTTVVAGSFLKLHHLFYRLMVPESPIWNPNWISMNPNWISIYPKAPPQKKGDPRTLRLISNNDAVSALIGIFDWSLLGCFASSGSHGLCEPRNASLGAAGATTNGKKERHGIIICRCCFFSFLL